MYIQKVFLLLLLLTQFTFSNDKARVIVVAGSSSWSPFSFIGEDGVAKGLLVDYWKEFAKKNSVKVEFLLSDWQTSLDNVKNSKADIHSGLFKSEERDAYFDFSNELPIELDTRLYVSRSIDASNFIELKGYFIAITKGSYEESFLQKNYPKSKLKVYKSSEESIEAAARGEIKAFVADYPMSLHRLKDAGILEEFHSTVTIYTNYMHVAVKDGNEDLLNFINNGIKNIQKDDVNRIVNKWFLPIEVIPSWLLPFVIGVIVCIVLVLLVFNIFILKRKVKLRTQELEKLAQTDSLTKCFNHQKIDETLSLEMLRAKRYNNPLSIVIIDIDDFKNINDQFGHLVGDSVLISFVELLKNNIRQIDSLGRWGGEEFVIVCPEISLSDANSFANKLCTKISQFDFSDIKIVTASFGVTEVKFDDDKNTIFSRADKALYIAKKEGKNRVKTL